MKREPIVLLPCPKCGEPTDLVAYQRAQTTYLHHVRCQSCKHETRGHATRAEAEGVWQAEAAQAAVKRDEQAKRKWNRGAWLADSQVQAAVLRDYSHELTLAHDIPGHGTCHGRVMRVFHDGEPNPWGNLQAYLVLYLGPTFKFVPAPYSTDSVNRFLHEAGFPLAEYPVRGHATGKEAKRKKPMPVIHGRVTDAVTV